MAEPGKPSPLGRSYQAEALRLLQRLQELRNLSVLPGVSYSEEVKKIQDRLEALKNRDVSEAAWNTVQIARHQERPQTLDYVAESLPDFLELQGDRLHGDDKAVVAGLGTLGERRIALIGHQKGHTLKERQERSFGMARPEGYRKAVRAARLAEKFGLPVVTLVDTPGAYPGKDAEEGGQAGAIARSMEAFANLAVPTVAVVIGEGGSGGALALAVADRVLMLENSVYSVISPEGCAALLWRDAAEAPRAAEALRLGARDLLALGVIDAVIPEPSGGAHTDHRVTIKRVMREVNLALRELERLDAAERLQLRRSKYLNMGSYRILE
ncbi:MAG: acetyl-CoA carboxylase carboxyltransferase subunit alpha [bacterium]